MFVDSNLMLTLLSLILESSLKGQKDYISL